ncbi:hypothetical protein EC991_000189 [Linnemannia zychae]|nr:hypothetical protein EC991_000189 [Linnemannia zychae]
MRGRLPETRPQQAQHHSQHLPRSVALPDWGFDPVTWKSLHATDTLEEPTDEEFSIQEYMYEFKADIQKVLSQSLIKIAPYSPTLNERLALLSIARVVQIEMHSLQDALSRCGRPPYQRGDSYISAPNWDSAYLTDIINAWNEPIALEPDYYLLKAMCLYEMGTSIQVSVLGQEKVQKFMNMALILTQKGERILKTKLGIGDCSDKIWRYQTMMSYVYQHQLWYELRGAVQGPGMDKDGRPG